MTPQPPTTPAIDTMNAANRPMTTHSSLLHSSGTAVIILSWDDLNSLTPSSTGPLADAIQQAFGHPESLGLCLIRGVPDLERLRAQLLPLASEFAALPLEAQERCVHEPSSYFIGWSCGKEVMNGTLDVAKGSFYANPLYEEGSGDPAFPEREEHACYRYPNIWPAELPQLQPALMELGSLIVRVGIQLGRHCDAYLARHDTALGHFFEKALVPSRTHKGRLLHYFPKTELSSASKPSSSEESQTMDSWCGLHVDNSILTGLTCAAYTDESDPSFPEITPPTNDPSGLYVKKGENRFIQVSIPRDCLAFQLGEAAQLGTNGLLRATEHLVKAATSATVARNTFAVFCQPNSDYPLSADGSYTFSDFSKDIVKRHY